MEKEKMIDYLLRAYHDVRQYDSKQFIYIQRLNKKLTPATTPLPYPKSNTDFPIQTSITIYKEDEEYLRNNPIEKPVIKEFYYTPNERLFTTRCLKRHNIPCGNLYQYLVYNKDGKFENIYNTVHEIT